MLVRFVVSNFLSFREETEFNLLTGSVRSLPDHVYEPIEGLRLLRSAAIYGANGAGKSNLVKAIEALHDTVVEGEWSMEKSWRPFKIGQATQGQPTHFEVEVVVKGQTYAYGLTVRRDTIVEEWLYRTEVEGKDECLFERTFQAGSLHLAFHPDYLQTEKSRLRKSLYEEELLKPQQLLLSLMAQAKDEFSEAKQVFQWFEEQLYYIFPATKPLGLAERLISLESFRQFTTELFGTLQTGVQELRIEELSLEEFLGENERDQIEEIKELLDEENQRLSLAHVSGSEEVVVRKQEEGHMVLRILPIHLDESGQEIEFTLRDESDGTRRLLELIPAFYQAMTQGHTVIIDEVGRSIHPALLKALLKKFSQESANGQLIFTTHESNLLDQEIFRRDEIWLTEKDKSGQTHMYPLSDFDIRKDLDIRKGYLNGRFGAIPFLGDLEHLNWSRYAEEEPSV